VGESEGKGRTVGERDVKARGQGGQERGGQGMEGMGKGKEGQGQERGGIREGEILKVHPSQ